MPEKDKRFRIEVTGETAARLDYIREQLGVSTRNKALDLAVISTYENIVESKMTEIDPLLPITVRLDEISAKLDLVLPDI
jgi:hypothetical protein